MTPEEEPSNLFLKLYEDIPRAGPGDDASTAKALALAPGLPSEPKILDVGCGPGMQTLTLARITGGIVTAVDTYQPFLDELNRRAMKGNLSARINTQNTSMFDLRFGEGSFDLIWSEGAIYIMGFREGLEAWKRFLKPGGALAITEVSWLLENPPDDLRDFWLREYPAIETVDENVNIIKESGYDYVDSFILPESVWWENYYTPLEKRIRLLRKELASDKEIIDALDEQQREIDLFRTYHDYYGYAFYVMQRPYR